MKPHCDSNQVHCSIKKKSKKIDLLFLGLVFVSIIFYLTYLISPKILLEDSYIYNLLSYNYTMINDMFIGVVIGIISVFIIDFIPKSIIYKILGNKKGISGILKAVLIGVIFDTCSHGILLVASKLYKQGIRLPQIIAFLCASPWNSISLTIIMISLIGIKITLAFILLSLIIAIVTGVVFDILCNLGYLKGNENELSLEELKKENLITFKKKITSKNYVINSIMSAIIDSKLIIKWLLFGTILASLISTFIPKDLLQIYLGPTIIGLLLTLFFSIIIEICSQGSLPLVTILITKAHAIGNAFTFLMSGIPTNYTQFLMLKEITNSWKIPILLIIVVIPQILIISYILNIFNI